MLRANREKEDKRIEAASNAKREGMNVSSEGTATATASASSTASATANATVTATTAMEVEDVIDEDEQEAMKAAMAMSLGKEMVTESTTKSSDLMSGENGGKGVMPSPDFMGIYELHSVVTHKGRAADSGHYIGWTRQEPGSKFWWKYDDDVVTEVKTEDIMLLDGGGDRDMAYLVFYRMKETPRA